MSTATMARTATLTDEQIQRDVLAELRFEPRVAQGTKAILRGTVRAWAEREEAERAAWAAPGITTVENLITISA